MNDTMNAPAPRDSRRARRWRVAALVTALAVAGSGCVVLSQGHVDGFAARKTGSLLEVGILDDTAATNTWREAPNVTLQVKAAARTTVPNDARYAFLGAVGTDVWILPQTQNPNLLWLGWNTQQIPSGFLQGNAIQWRLVSMTGPGAFHLYTVDGFGNPTVLFESDNGLPDSVNVPTNTHAHGNWAFSAAGTYKLTFRGSGTKVGGGVVTDEAVHTFDVKP